MTVATRKNGSRSIVTCIVLAALSVVVSHSASIAGERSHVSVRRDPPIVRRMVLGHSSQGRPIIAFRLGDPTSETTILVVGCIHGNECAGTAIARALIASPPAGIDLWVIRNLNPDGFRAGTRQNGRGVDLNRNFPFHWRRGRAAVGQGVLGTSPALRTRGPDRAAPDRAGAPGREHLVPPTARSRGSVGGRPHDPAAVRPARRTPLGQADGTLSGQRDELAEPLAPGGGRLRRRTLQRAPSVDGGRPVRRCDRKGRCVAGNATCPTAQVGVLLVPLVPRRLYVPS